MLDDMKTSLLSSPKRNPSGLHLALADRIAQLDAQAWNETTAEGSWFFSRDYLSMLEGVLPAAIRPHSARTEVSPRRQSAADCGLGAAPPADDESTRANAARAVASGRGARRSPFQVMTTPRLTSFTFPRGHGGPLAAAGRRP